MTGLFSFLSAWNEFLLALVFNTDNSQFTLPVGCIHDSINWAAMGRFRSRQHSRQCPRGDFVLLVSARANRRDERGLGEGLGMASVEFKSVAKRFSADAAALTDLS